MKAASLSCATSGAAASTRNANSAWTSFMVWGLWCREGVDKGAVGTRVAEGDTGLPGRYYGRTPGCADERGLITLPRLLPGNPRDPRNPCDREFRSSSNRPARTPLSGKAAATPDVLSSLLRDRLRHR